MSKHTGPDTTFPEFVAFLATIPPDQTLTDLGDAYTARYARMVRTRQRQAEITERLSALDAAIVEAEGKQRASLLSERALLREEHDVLPVQVAVEKRLHAEAHLRWLARLAVLAQADAEAANAALEPGRVEMRRITRALNSVDARMLPHDELAAETARLIGESRTVGATLQPDRERMQRALLVLDIVRTRAEWAYGDDFKLDNELTWTDALQRCAGTDARRAPVVRSFVHA